MNEQILLGLVIAALIAAAIVARMASGEHQGLSSKFETSRLWESDMCGDRIDFISEYCDRWCERCAFTGRCSAYAVKVALEMCEGDFRGSHRTCRRRTSTSQRSAEASTRVVR